MPPEYAAIYVATSETDFYRRALNTDLRSAQRNIEIAGHATPKEEEDYGESNIYAALQYISAKFGKLGDTLPVAFDRLKIPVRDGAHAGLVKRVTEGGDA